MTVSVSSGRCGPCCSVDPSGSTRVGVPTVGQGRSASVGSTFTTARSAGRADGAGGGRGGSGGRGFTVAEPEEEVLGCVEILRAELDGRGSPQPEDGRVEAAAENVQHVLHPGLAVRRQAPEVSAADQDGAGPQREGLGDVTAAPDPAVEEDLDLVTDGLGDAGQNPDRRGRRVEVVA